MNVLVIGNMNGLNEVLARELCEAGFFITHILCDSGVLHSPRRDYENKANIEILDLRNKPEVFFLSNNFSKLIHGILMKKSYSFCILNSYGVSVGQDLKIPYFAHLTGSDLSEYARYGSIRNRLRGTKMCGRLRLKVWVRLIQYGCFVYSQRRAIRLANLVSSSPPGINSENDLFMKNIGVSSNRRFWDRFIDISTIRQLSQNSSIDDSVLPSSNNSQVFKIFSGARILFPTEDSSVSLYDDKRTDILLQGFAEYVSRNGIGELFLVAKGPHIELAQDTIRALGLEGRIVWLPECDYSAHLLRIRNADVVIDQLGLGQTNGIAVEAMALGKPVIANFRNSGWATFGEDFPGINAADSSDLASHLLGLERSPGHRTVIGQKGIFWTTNFLDPKRYVERLLNMMNIDMVQ